MTLLFYELLVSRLFTIFLPAYFAYMVVSFSILGLGLGGLLTYYLSMRHEFPAMTFTWAYIVSYIGTISVVFWAPFLGNAVVYVILATMPFIYGGALIAHVFMTQNTFSAYLADLAGALVGVAGAVLLMNYAGLPQAVVAAFVLAALLGVILSERRSSAAVALVLIVTLISANGALTQSYTHGFRGFMTSPYVRLLSFGREIAFTSWDSFARTDVVASKDDPHEKVVGLNGNSLSTLVHWRDDPGEMQYLKNRIGYLPMEMGSQGRIALIGSGGGEEIIFALLAGFEDITAIEINRGTVLAQQALADYSGDLYRHPRVTAVVGDGRSYMRQTTRTFDHIYLSLVMNQTRDSMVNTLSENFIYTKQALADYLERLNPGGQVSFVLHDQMDLLRVLTTVIEYFGDRGVQIEDVARRIVIAFKPSEGRHGIMFPLLAVSPEPLTPAAIGQAADIIQRYGFTPIHLPGIVNEELLRRLSAGETTVPQLAAGLPFDITPTTDDRPWFYHFGRGAPAPLWDLLMVGSALMGVVYYLGARRGRRRVRGFGGYFAMFALIGAGFIGLEITLMQKLILWLEHPTTSFVTVLTILLIGAGVGNLMQIKWGIFRRRNPLAYLVLCAAVQVVALSRLTAWGVAQPVWIKIAATSAVLLPVGFLMGIPFPMALGVLRQRGHGEMVPFFWSVDGLGTVVGSVLTVICALVFGFTVTSYAAIAVYAGAAVLFGMSVLRGGMVSSLGDD
jgi:hypothetical protein